MICGSLWFAVIALTLGLSSCGMNSQTKGLRAFEKCEYEIQSADSIFIANRNVLALLEKEQFNIQDLGGVALSFLTGEVPLVASLKVKIKNPTRDMAAVNQFQYRIMMQEKLLAEGTSDLPVRVPAEDEAIVPVQLKANIFPIFQDRAMTDQLMGFMNQNQPITFTISIKPTLSLGNTAIDYPGYISFKKTIYKDQLTLQ